MGPKSTELERQNILTTHQSFGDAELHSLVAMPTVQQVMSLNVLDKMQLVIAPAAPLEPDYSAARAPSPAQYPVVMSPGKWHT